jgi:hypothetical protein
LFNSQAALNQTAQLKTVLEVTQASLAAERSSARDAAEQAAACEASLEQYKDALQSCAEQLDRSQSTQAELQSAASESARKVLQMQEALARSEASCKLFCDQLSNERMVAADERARLGQEMSALRDGLTEMRAGQDSSVHRAQLLSNQAASAEADKRTLEAALAGARADAEAARRAQDALRHVLALQQHRKGDPVATSVTAPTIAVVGGGARTPPPLTSAPGTSIVGSAAGLDLLSPGAAALHAALQKARARREGHDVAGSSATTLPRYSGEPITGVRKNGASVRPEKQLPRSDDDMSSAIASLLEQLLVQPQHDIPRQQSVRTKNAFAPAGTAVRAQQPGTAKKMGSTVGASPRSFASPQTKINPPYSVRAQQPSSDLPASSKLASRSFAAPAPHKFSSFVTAPTLRFSAPSLRSNSLGPMGATKKPTGTSSPGHSLQAVHLAKTAPSLAATNVAGSGDRPASIVRSSSPSESTACFSISPLVDMIPVLPERARQPGTGELSQTAIPVDSVGSIPPPRLEGTAFIVRSISIACFSADLLILCLCFFRSHLLSQVTPSLW